MLQEVSTYPYIQTVSITGPLRRLIIIIIIIIIIFLKITRVVESWIFSICFYVGVISAIFFRASFPLSVLLFVPSTDSVSVISLLKQHFNKSEQNWTELLLILLWFAFVNSDWKLASAYAHKNFLKVSSNTNPLVLRPLKFQPGTF
jgi:hypothetical protein